jgi:hypothetical protein
MLELWFERLWTMDVYVYGAGPVVRRLFAARSECRR